LGMSASFGGLPYSVPPTSLCAHTDNHPFRRGLMPTTDWSNTVGGRGSVIARGRADEAGGCARPAHARGDVWDVERASATGGHRGAGWVLGPSSQRRARAPRASAQGGAREVRSDPPARGRPRNPSIIAPSSWSSVARRVARSRLPRGPHRPARARAARAVWAGFGRGPRTSRGLRLTMAISAARPKAAELGPPSGGATLRPSCKWVCPPLRRVGRIRPRPLRRDLLNLSREHRAAGAQAHSA
jgi:hypothetical protein